MRVLVYHGKHGTELFKADDELDALWKLFNKIDAIGYYKHDLEGDEKAFYIAAKQGEKKSAATLLQCRKRMEYENWEFEEVR